MGNCGSANTNSSAGVTEMRITKNIKTDEHFIKKYTDSRMYERKIDIEFLHKGVYPDNTFDGTKKFNIELCDCFLLRDYDIIRRIQVLHPDIIN